MVKNDFATVVSAPTDTTGQSFLFSLMNISLLDSAHNVSHHFDQVKQLVTFRHRLRYAAAHPARRQ